MAASGRQIWEYPARGPPTHTRPQGVTDEEVVHDRQHSTVKPVCSDHLYNKIYYLWFIQQCVLMKTVGTNLLLLTISAF